MKRFCHNLLLLIVSGISLPSIGQPLPKVQVPTFKKDTFNIKKFGAIADGMTLNTVSINSAIDACNKNGGGTVLVPNGFWLTGPIVIKSNVDLHISRGAVLQFTSDFDQYPLVEGNFEGVPAFRNQSPLSATNAENIAVTGDGVIDGNGDAWRMVKRDKQTETQWKKLVASGGSLSEDGKTWYPTQKTVLGSKTKEPGVIKPGVTRKDVEAYKDFLRPNLFVLTRCKKILLQGVTFQNSPAWDLHPLMCEDMTVREIYAKNPFYAQNGDGIDIESCKNFIVENSTFDVGDDGICIKSGRDAEGRKRGMPTENGIIRNCIVYHAHGGFVIGSEMSGGAKNLYVSNCTFIGTDVGLRFKTARGRGGIVEKIYVSHINMKDIAGEAILFDMYYMAKDPVPLAGEKRDAPKVELLPVTEGTPQFRDFHVKDIVCDGAETAILIRGLPEMSIKDIDLQDMVIKSRIGVVCEEASGIQIKNLNLVTTGSGPQINILNGNNISFEGMKYKDGADLLISLNGERTAHISLKNMDTSKAKKKAQFGNGVKESVLN